MPTSSFGYIVAAVLSIGVVAMHGRQSARASDDVIRSLAEAHKDTRSVAQIRKDNAMIAAASKGDAEAVSQAIKNGALVDSRYLDPAAFLDEGQTGYTALMRATLGGHDKVVKLLLENKPDLELERHGKTSLYFAVLKDRVAIVELLRDAGAKGDPKQIRLTQDLIRAACRGFKMNRGEGYPLFPGYVGDPAKAPEILEVLQRGADVNAADPEGYTALMYAANLGLVDNVSVLLAHGADPRQKSKEEETALSLAERRESSVAREGRRKVIELLNLHLAKNPERP